jgi:hypothetical protein
MDHFQARTEKKCEEEDHSIEDLLNVTRLFGRHIGYLYLREANKSVI